RPSSSPSSRVWSSRPHPWPEARRPAVGSTPGGTRTASGPAAGRHGAGRLQRRRALGGRPRGADLAPGTGRRPCPPDRRAPPPDPGPDAAAGPPARDVLVASRAARRAVVPGRAAARGLGLDRRALAPAAGRGRDTGPDLHQARADRRLG